MQRPVSVGVELGQFTVDVDGVSAVEVDVLVMVRPDVHEASPSIHLPQRRGAATVGPWYSDDQAGGGVSSLNGRGDAQQLVPRARDQAAGQRQPTPRVPVGELLPRSGTGILPGRECVGELLAHEVEQREVREGGAVGVGGVLMQRQVGLVAQQPFQDVSADVGSCSV
jgi:hypothetical protein